MYGSDKRLRITLEARAQPDVLAVRSNEHLTTMADVIAIHDASSIADALAISAWHRYAAGEGSKGPLLP